MIEKHNNLTEESKFYIITNGVDDFGNLIYVTKFYFDNDNDPIGTAECFDISLALKVSDDKSSLLCLQNIISRCKFRNNFKIAKGRTTYEIIDFEIKDEL